MRCFLIQQVAFLVFLTLLFLPVNVLAGEQKADHAKLYSDRINFDWKNLIHRSRLAGLQVFESDHLVLITDRPPRAGDDMEELPEVFDEAVNIWADHYSVPLSVVSDWKVCSCLIVDRERFREAGLLPDTIPDFTHGYCDHYRFWFVDQSNPAYRRHLMLHEGVHAFTATVLKMSAPTWYTEGIAEWLATHRLVKEGKIFEHTPIPSSPNDVEQLGRIETIHRLFNAGQATGIQDVFKLRPTRHGTINSYALAWSVVAFLATHPRYKEAFAAMEQGPFDDQITQRLTTHAGWNPIVASRDFSAFISELDYGYDTECMVIDWSQGDPVVDKWLTSSVAADRGWQNPSWCLEAGQRYRLQATGLCSVGTIQGGDGQLDLESTADGISFDWYHGKPLGRLLVAQWVTKESQSHFELIGEGAEINITARHNGPLFLKINNLPGRLRECRGEIRVQIVHVESAERSPSKQ
jgi:hypothetical protein